MFLVGCGNVGEPLPPLIQIPVAVSDLQAMQFGTSVLLSWTLPTLNTDGSAATTLAAVEIYRMVADSSAAAPDLKQFGTSAVLWKRFPKESFDSLRDGSKLVARDTFDGLPVPKLFQSQFYYAVRAVNQKKQDAGFSNLVSVRPYAVPEPPENLRAELAERYIGLSWDIPSQNYNGSPVRTLPRFNVYRSLDAAGAAASRLNERPVDNLSFKDETVQLDKTYYYFIRSVVETPEGSVESENSKLMAVTHADTYPPKPPAEVAAVSNGQVISLVWLPNPEPDLAGYWVFRAGADRQFRRLNEHLLTTASTIDKSVEKGQTYVYRIKAVDLHGNESDLSEEVSETLEEQ